MAAWQVLRMYDVDGKCSNEGGNNEDGKDGRELGLPGILHVDE